MVAKIYKATDLQKLLSTEKAYSNATLSPLLFFSTDKARKKTTIVTEANVQLSYLQLALVIWRFNVDASNADINMEL